MLPNIHAPFRGFAGVLRLRSGFRLAAQVPLTPPKRLKFDPDQVHHSKELTLTSSTVRSGLQRALNN